MLYLIRVLLRICSCPAPHHSTETAAKKSITLSWYVRVFIRLYVYLDVHVEILYLSVYIPSPPPFSSLSLSTRPASQLYSILTYPHHLHSNLSSSLSCHTQHKEPDYSSKMFPKALDTTIDFLKQVSMVACCDLQIFIYCCPMRLIGIDMHSTR